MQQDDDWVRNDSMEKGLSPLKSASQLSKKSFLFQ